MNQNPATTTPVPSGPTAPSFTPRDDSLEKDLDDFSQVTKVRASQSVHSADSSAADRKTDCGNYIDALKLRLAYRKEKTTRDPQASVAQFTQLIASTRDTERETSTEETAESPSSSR